MLLTGRPRERLRKIKPHHQMAVVGRGRMPPDIGLAEQFLETVLAIDVVVAFQDRAPEAFAEATGTQEHRDLVLLELMDKPGLVHEIIVFADNLLIVCHGVWNASFHAMQYAGSIP